MIRFLIYDLVPLLAPLVIYVLWVWWSRRRIEGGLLAKLEKGPVFWSLVAGFLSMLVVLLFLAAGHEGKPGTTYEAPRYQDGQVIPGHFK